MKYDRGGLMHAFDCWISNADMIFFWQPYEKDGKITKACFCQWYPSYFVLDGIRYNCAEQFMMAEKARIFGDQLTRKKILKETDPQVMKHLGREVQGFNPNIWDRKSYDVVVRGNVAKFSQNESLKKVLLETGDKALVEASPYDTIWGIGMDEEEAMRSYPHIWRGENKLGFALMEVRDILNEEKD